MTSIEHALVIPELLELTLSFLDWRTAVRAQRVSKQWHETIHHGSNGQDKLGFKALERREHWLLGQNSLHMIASARRLHKDELRHYRDAEDQLVVVRAKPTAVASTFTKSTIERLWSKRYGNQYMFLWEQIPKPLLKNDPQASWRSMQFTQPPTFVMDAFTTAYYVDVLMFRRVPGHRALTQIRNSSGITIGQVLDTVKKWKAEAPPGIDWGREMFTFTTVNMVDYDAFLMSLSKAPLDIPC